MAASHEQEALPACRLLPAASSAHKPIWHRGSPPRQQLYPWLTVILPFFPQLQAAGNAVKRASDNLVKAAQKAAAFQDHDETVVVKEKMVGGIAQVRSGAASIGQGGSGCLQGHTYHLPTWVTEQHCKLGSCSRPTQQNLILFLLFSSGHSQQICTDVFGVTSAPSQCHGVCEG